MIARHCLNFSIITTCWAILVNYFKKEEEAYEEAFYDFEPEKVAQMTAQDIDRLMTFPNIVHHRKKLEAILNQAQGYLKIEQAYRSFS